jgi:hypothetical protein
LYFRDTVIITAKNYVVKERLWEKETKIATLAKLPGSQEKENLRESMKRGRKSLSSGLPRDR